MGKSVILSRIALGLFLLVAQAGSKRRRELVAEMAEKETVGPARHLPTSLANGRGVLEIGALDWQIFPALLGVGGERGQEDRSSAGNLGSSWRTHLHCCLGTAAALGLVFRVIIGRRIAISIIGAQPLRFRHRREMAWRLLSRWWRRKHTAILYMTPRYRETLCSLDQRRS